MATMQEVTSLAEVWIEIFGGLEGMIGKLVTSLAEVWIEIICINVCHYSTWSLPLRKCGLK